MKIRIASKSAGWNAWDVGWHVDERIKADPRLSQAQLEAIVKIARADADARFRGFDQKIRPVITTKSGAGAQITYALMRNGDPAKPEKPWFEYWPVR